MITIIHGDDTSLSRKFLTEQKEKLNNFNSFDSAEFNLSSLAQIVEGASLFDDTKIIFVENFFSKNKLVSNEAKALVNYINKNSDLIKIFFWEDKEVSKKSISVFNNSTVKIFKIPQSIFLFLDGIKPKNWENSIGLFHKSLVSVQAELIFFMLVRQFRLLLAIQDNSTDAIDEVKRLMPWQKSKLEHQSNLFTKDQLRNIYKKLLQIDIEQKTGKSAFSLAQAIDFLLIDL